MIVRSVAGLALVGALLTSCTTTTSGAPRTAPSGPPAPAARASLFPPAQAGAVLSQASVAAAAAQGARTAFGAVDSYDYRSMDASLTAALRFTTGTFATTYAKTFRDVLVPEAVRLKAVQHTQLTQVAVQQVALPTKVQLLVAGSVRVSKNGKPAVISAFDAQLTMTLVGGTWLVSGLDGDAQGTTPPAGTPALAAAIAAAKTAVVAVTTLSRKSFDADYDTALAFTTGPLHSDLVDRRSRVRSALAKGGFDLRGEIPALGVVDAIGTKVHVLVDTRGYRVVGGTPGPATVGRDVVTVVLVGGHWAASDLTSVT